MPTVSKLRRSMWAETNHALKSHAVILHDFQCLLWLVVAASVLICIKLNIAQLCCIYGNFFADEHQHTLRISDLQSRGHCKSLLFVNTSHQELGNCCLGRKLLWLWNSHHVCLCLLMHTFVQDLVVQFQTL